MTEFFLPNKTPSIKKRVIANAVIAVKKRTPIFVDFIKTYYVFT